MKGARLTPRPRRPSARRRQTVAHGLLLGLLLLTARAAAQRPDADAEGTAREATRLLRRFAHEPAVGVLARAALRRAQLEPWRVASALARARQAAALPRLKTSVSRELRRYDSYLTTPDPRLDAGAALLFEVSTTWQLDRLVFHPAEVGILRQAARAQAARTELLRLVTQIYYERRLLQVELAAAPPAELKAAVAKRLKLEELTALLEGLTGQKLAPHATGR